MDNPESDEVEHFREDLLDCSEENIRSFPWRRSDTTPYEMLLAEIFLKQTRSATVAKILPEFLEKFPDPEALDQAKKDEIVKIIRPLGLYNYRSEALQEIGEHLAQSEIPQTEEKLMKFPQVGKSVLNAALRFGFNHQRSVLDSIVGRVYSSVFNEVDISATPKDEHWEFAELTLHNTNVEQYNLAPVNFGAGICTDSAPAYKDCFVNKYCSHYQNQQKEPFKN